MWLGMRVHVHIFESLHLVGSCISICTQCPGRWGASESVTAVTQFWLPIGRCVFLGKLLNFSLFFFSFIFISWRLITLQYCSGFCHTMTWISHGFTCIPHPDSPSHLPLYLIPLGLPSAPGPSTCLMHLEPQFHIWKMSGKYITDRSHVENRDVLSIRNIVQRLPCGRGLMSVHFLPVSVCLFGMKRVIWMFLINWASRSGSIVAKIFFLLSSLPFSSLSLF